VGPPADDVDWSEQTDELIEGCARFLRRVWRLAHGEGAAPASAPDEVDRATHQLIARVSEDYDRWSYNTAVAAFMEHTNLLYRDGVTDFAVDTLLLLMAPMAPHFAAEAWERRHGDHIHEHPWPKADPDLARPRTVTLVVQVNGKVRDRLEVSATLDAAEAERLALASAKVQEQLGGGKPTKVVTRPPKLVNIVV
jgi:leucyl-tRNA synthetase